MGGKPKDVEVAEATQEEDRLRLLPRLLRGTPDEILSRVTDGDPLRMEQLSANRLNQGFFLLDPERVRERALARVALMAPKTPVEQLDREWLNAQIDHAVARVLDEEHEEERDSPFACDPEDPRYRVLRALFVAGGFARTASWAFNRLPERTRRAFHYLCIEKREVVDCLLLGIWDEDALYDDIWRALAALGYHNGDGRPDPDCKGGLET